MAAKWIRLSMFVVLSNTEEIATDCETSPIHEPIYGKTCETSRYMTIIAATENHHCTLACIGNTDCKAIIYDDHQSVCILLQQPCILLQSHTDHVYQSFEHQCTKWIPTGHDVPAFWIYESGTAKSYVTRMYVNDDALIGKATNNIFRAIFPNASVFQNAEGHHEVLVVDDSCRVTWVWYDATSGQPLPTGAFIGGFWEDTPMYVSRLPIQGNLIVGYYDPLNNQARGEFRGSRSRSHFDVMVVQSRHIISWEQPCCGNLRMTYW